MIGVPAEAQHSEFGGKRSRSGMNEARVSNRDKRYGACGDEVS